MKLSALVALVCLLPALASAQATQLRLSVSPSSMVWRADLFGSLGSLTVDGSSAAIGATSARGSSRRPTAVAGRALKLIGFDLPVSWFFVSWNHEYGHITRATEAGIDVRLTRVGWPWTYPRFELVAASVYPRVGHGSMFDLAAESGGLEASWVLKDRLEQEARRRPLTAGEAMTAVWASLNTTVYAQVNTPDDLFQQVVPSGDVARYSHQWIQDSTREIPGPHPDRVVTLRRRTLLNLADAALILNVFGVLHDYVFMGRESVTERAISIGGVHVLPSLRYALTPLGPEVSVRSSVVVGRAEWSGYFRSTEGASANGMGLEHSRNLTDRLAARASLDFWRQPASRHGSRQQLSLRFHPASNNSLGYLEALVARKSEGYIQGQPLKAGLQLGASLGYRW